MSKFSGSSKWSSDKHGVGIGRINDYQRPSLLSAALSLINPWVGSADACDRFIGAVLRRPKVSAWKVRLSKSPHSVFAAPSGIGKTTMLAVPELMSNPNPMVVNDYDGVLARLTGEFRRKKFGHRQIYLDPMRVFTDKPDTLNPLDTIVRGSPLAIDKSRNMAAAMTIYSENERDVHWLQGSENILGVTILTVIEKDVPGQRNLQAVRRILADPAEFSGMVEFAATSSAYEGMLSVLGNQLKHYIDRELASTMTTTNRMVRFMDSLAVRESMLSSTFDPRQIRDGLDVYMIVPLRFSSDLAPLTRLWITTILDAVTEGGPIE